MNTAIVSGAQNVGFAIPIDRIKRDIESVEKNGKISYGFLGINYVIIDQELAQKNKLGVDYGALVTRPRDGARAVVAR